MRRLRAKVAPKRPREKEGQFKCSACDPEQAFETRETLMHHIKDHHKPVLASPISNHTEAKAVSRSDEEDHVEETMKHSQENSLHTPM